MAVNLDKPHLWKEDITRSVDMYNDWFLKFAPRAFRETRARTSGEIENMLKATKNLTDIAPSVLRNNPNILPALRMSTCPPLAVDRLVGLANVSQSLIKKMEKSNLPLPRHGRVNLGFDLRKVGTIIEKMADPDIFVWLNRTKAATKTEIRRAASIVADRLCGSCANPIIRNAQEKRQLASIKKWLERRGYRQIASGERVRFDTTQPGTFGFRINVPVVLRGGSQIKIPIDAVIMPKDSHAGDLPILFEAKSAGDFTNVNKRRKEEAAKMSQLRQTYGDQVRFSLLLCGYFNSGYLGYEAAEGIDWIWEHRIDDLAEFGL